jgi:hypothetical protein
MEAYCHCYCLRLTATACGSLLLPATHCYCYCHCYCLRLTFICSRSSGEATLVPPANSSAVAPLMVLFQLKSSEPDTLGTCMAEDHRRRALLHCEASALHSQAAAHTSSSSTELVQ